MMRGRAGRRVTRIPLPACYNFSGSQGMVGRRIQDLVKLPAEPPPPAEAGGRVVVGPEGAGKRLDVALVAAFAGVSRSQFARHIGEGAVTVNGAPAAAPSQKVRPGDVLLFSPGPVRKVALEAEEIPLQVVHEDRWLIVIDKPAGLVVHPAPGHEAGTLVNALLAHCRDLRGIGGELRPGIVHRLDRGTSGLMVVAKDDATLAALGADFKVHRILRQYEALALGAPPRDSGRIETLHGRDPHDRKKFSIKVRTGRKAITEWRVLERLPGLTRIEAELQTGRTHQVRLHLASLGCPVLGDSTYGRPPRDPELRSLAQHANTLGFHHPASGQWLQWSAPLPADVAQVLEQARARPAAAAVKGSR
jgi:23S rRNA pseudouridine1911/1915/1917 synthase